MGISIVPFRTVGTALRLHSMRQWALIGCLPKWVTYLEYSSQFESTKPSLNILHCLRAQKQVFCVKSKGITFYILVLILHWFLRLRAVFFFFFWENFGASFHVLFTVHVHRMLFKAHHVEKFYVRVWTEVNPLLLTWWFNQKESKKKKGKGKR